MKKAGATREQQVPRPSAKSRIVNVIEDEHVGVVVR